MDEERKRGATAQVSAECGLRRTQIGEYDGILDLELILHGMAYSPAISYLGRIGSSKGAQYIMCKGGRALNIRQCESLRPSWHPPHPCLPFVMSTNGSYMKPATRRPCCPLSFVSISKHP